MWMFGNVEIWESGVESRGVTEISKFPNLQISKSHERRQDQPQALDFLLELRKDFVRGVEVAVEADRFHPRGGVAGCTGGEVADRALQGVRGAPQPLGVAVHDGPIDVVDQAAAVLQEELDQPSRQAGVVAEPFEKCR